MGHYSLEVIKSKLGETRITTPPAPTDIVLQSGEAIIQVDKFALTANNITYGVAGDMIGYWQFFPAEADWGRIPVWGKGTVLDPGETALTAGDEYYGYYPMSSYLVVKPENTSPRGFIDGAEHRAALPPAYNQYSLMSEENGFDRSRDNQRMAFYPLFVTGFILDDYLFDNDFFGADRIILSSASSKTSISLAFMLSKRAGKTCTGLTSKANKAFVESLNIYQDVLTYDEVAQLPATEKIAYVDMAGNRSLLTDIHHHFGENVVCSCGVGITHRDARDGDNPNTLPGAPQTMFFAPTQIQKRNQDWGPEKFQQTLNGAWDSFLDNVGQWITIDEGTGQEALITAYETVLNGAPPNQAYIVSL